MITIWKGMLWEAFPYRYNCYCPSNHTHTHTRSHMYKDNSCKILYASEQYDLDYDPDSSLNVNNYRH